MTFSDQNIALKQSLAPDARGPAVRSNGYLCSESLVTR